MLRLYEAGEKVLPKVVGTSVTVDGETRKLTKKEYKRYKDIYNDALSAIDNVIYTPEYQLLDDKGKASVIRKIYSAYKEKAAHAVFGSELSNVNLFEGHVKIYKQAVASALIDSIREEYSETDAKLTAQAVCEYLYDFGYTKTEAEALLYLSGYRSKALKKKFEGITSSKKAS